MFSAIGPAATAVSCSLQQLQGARGEATLLSAALCCLLLYLYDVSLLPLPTICDLEVPSAEQLYSSTTELQPY